MEYSLRECCALAILFTELTALYFIIELSHYHIITLTT
ncbi:hypothetical protein Niako_0424 [Niastella koreensis GR20-10]|uniref:Uncharacterized protein n=1 Tax=Niastella koreensis (strain DSM 17620 / KACC 11465 / NBRC 106392 / GR20-10) TaxID=700598 RepID=G8T6H7_NIAKG|nr:hypothetical protein Niako_0424 [Niastella koreensis GR20-10]